MDKSIVGHCPIHLNGMAAESKVRSRLRYSTFHCGSVMLSKAGSYLQRSNTQHGLANVKQTNKQTNKLNTLCPCYHCELGNMRTDIRVKVIFSLSRYVCVVTCMWLYHINVTRLNVNLGFCSLFGFNVIII